MRGYGDKMTPLMYVRGMFTKNSYSKNHYGYYGPALVCFNLLVKHSADSNIPSDEGYTPIFCLMNNLDTECSDDAFDNFEVLKKLVNYGADINFISIRKKSIFKRSETPLISTLRSMSENKYFSQQKCIPDYQIDVLIHIMNYLIPKGLNLNLRDYNDHTALHYASSLSNTRLLSYFLQAGADY